MKDQCGGDLRQELRQQCGFADTGSAAEHHQSGLARARFVPRAKECVEISCATDEPHAVSLAPTLSAPARGRAALARVRRLRGRRLPRSPAISSHRLASSRRPRRKAATPASRGMKKHQPMSKRTPRSARCWKGRRGPRNAVQVVDEIADLDGRCEGRHVEHRRSIGCRPPTKRRNGAFVAGHGVNQIAETLDAARRKQLPRIEARPGHPRSRQPWRERRRERGTGSVTSVDNRPSASRVLPRDRIPRRRRSALARLRPRPRRPSRSSTPPTRRSARRPPSPDALTRRRHRANRPPTA